MNSFNDLGINKKTYDIIIEDQKINTDFKNDKIISTIEIFTKIHKNNPFNKFNLLICDYYFNLEQLKIKKYEHEFAYKTTEKEIKFKKLSDSIIQKNTKKELKTNKRYGKCHTASFALALYSTKNCEIITGFVDEFNHRLMHSIVEYNHNGLYIDYTKNLIMNKNDYINIYHFKEISRVTSKQVKEDVENIFPIIDKIGLKSYLCFRNEIVKDLEKNHSITYKKKYLHKNMPKRIY